MGSDQHRAAAIWALLVLDAVIRLGRVEYERPISTPNSKTVDVYLHTGGNSGVWIEAAYLVERFVENERRSDLLRRRFHEEGQARGVPGHYLWARLDGESTLGRVSAAAASRAGALTHLPCSADSGLLRSDPGRVTCSADL